MLDGDERRTQLHAPEPGLFDAGAMARELSLPVQPRIFVEEVQERDAPVDPDDVGHIGLLARGQRLGGEAKRADHGCV